MFSDTSRNISYDTNTGILSAQCQTDDKQWRNSWLNINDCLLWQYPKIVPYKGPRETSEWNLSLATSRADHERNTASFGGTTISFTHETEGNNSTKRWHVLWYGNRWNGVWSRMEAKVNLDDYVRNKNGVLEFVSEDKEPAWFWKQVVWLLSKLPAPNTRAMVISIAVEDKARKDEFAKKSKSQEDWLKNTYVEGKNRIVRGVNVESKL